MASCEYSSMVFCQGITEFCAVVLASLRLSVRPHKASALNAKRTVQAVVSETQLCVKGYPEMDC